uniref:NIDO domain-containing protein n=1 Tax=Callorhinchus milii TaxID=7868 RepID=A0A4W3GBW1_CALMI
MTERIDFKIISLSKNPLTLWHLPTFWTSFLPHFIICCWRSAGSGLLLVPGHLHTPPRWQCFKPIHPKALQLSPPQSHCLAQFFSSFRSQLKTCLWSLPPSPHSASGSITVQHSETCKCKIFCFAAVVAGDGTVTKYLLCPQVNNNGIISLQGSVRQFTPSPFPLADNRSLIAPFWADVNNAIAGEIYFNESTEESVLQRASEDIDNYFPGLNTSAHWVFVATWDHVAYFGSSSQKRNTFQAVLIQSGSHSFIIFNYGDIEWTTGTAGGGNGNTGLGGTPAVVREGDGDSGV